MPPRQMTIELTRLMATALGLSIGIGMAFGGLVLVIASVFGQ